VDAKEPSAINHNAGGKTAGPATAAILQRANTPAAAAAASAQADLEHAFIYT
jgi:hypothetical protein